MNTTTKPPRRPMPVPAPRASAPDLTPDEACVLSAFRAMDARRKGEAVHRMKRIANTYPENAAPLLRLGRGGEV
jgi:hypothetical protein